jgi:hypothetical protein
MLIDRQSGIETRPHRRVSNEVSDQISAMGARDGDRTPVAVRA